MDAHSRSPMLWLFYLQLTLLLGPGVVALFDLWLHNRREAKSRGILPSGAAVLRKPSAGNEETLEESRRAS